MKIIKVSEASCLQLDWMVAKALDLQGKPLDWSPSPYSTDWSQGGPIIEREELSVEPTYAAGKLHCWQAYGHNLRYDDNGNYIDGSDHCRYGPTPLVAAMRCYVTSKLGDIVEVPKELT